MHILDIPYISHYSSPPPQLSPQPHVIVPMDPDCPDRTWPEAGLRHPWRLRIEIQTTGTTCSVPYTLYTWAETVNFAASSTSFVNITPHSINLPYYPPWFILDLPLHLPSYQEYLFALSPCLQPSRDIRAYPGVNIEQHHIPPTYITYQTYVPSKNLRQRQPLTTCKHSCSPHPNTYACPELSTPKYRSCCPVPPDTAQCPQTSAQLQRAYHYPYPDEPPPTPNEMPPSQRGLEESRREHEAHTRETKPPRNRSCGLRRKSNAIWSPPSGSSLASNKY